MDNPRNRSQAGSFNPLPAVRPAGFSGDESSDYDDDDDGFDLPGLTRRNRRVVPVPPPVSGTAILESYQNGGGDDWSRVTDMRELNEYQEGRLACQNGDLDKVKELITAGKLETGAYYEDGFTPLHAAAHYAQPVIMKYLLDQGVNTDILSDKGKISPLIAAVSCTRQDVEEEAIQECCQLLVDKHCNVNMQDASARSALVVAIKRHHERRRVAQYLLECGADPNVQDKTGRTPLFHAAEVGDGRSCRLLLEKGADINHIDDAGWSAYDVASDKGFYSLAELLYYVKNTKWRPGDNPKLMQEIEEQMEEKRHERIEVKEDSQIETILRASGAAKYYPNFRKHKVQYLQFLQFDEEDLKSVGVEQVGIRKKILDAIKEIHNTDYSRNSLNIVPINKKVTAAEVICVFNNAKMHIRHIATTLKYLKTRILKEPENLRIGKEKNKIQDIIGLLEELNKNNFELEKEVLETLHVFRALKANPELQIGDAVECKKGLKELLELWEVRTTGKSDEERTFTKIVKNKVLPGVVAALGIGFVVYRLRGLKK